MISLETAAGLCSVPWPLPEELPGVLLESLEREAQAQDAVNTDALWVSRDRRYISQVYLKSPYGPDLLVFGEVDAQPVHGECEYAGGAPVACTACKAMWLGDVRDACWFCGGAGDYA